MHNIARADDVLAVQNGKYPLLATADFMRHRISAKGTVGMVRQIEDRDRAFPHQLFAPHLANGHGLDECRRAAVLGFHGLPELVGCGFDHESHNPQGGHRRTPPTPCPSHVKPRRQMT